MVDDCESSDESELGTLLDNFELSPWLLSFELKDIEGFEDETAELDTRLLELFRLCEKAAGELGTRLLELFRLCEEATVELAAGTKLELCWRLLLGLTDDEGTSVGADFSVSDWVFTFANCELDCV